MFYRKISVWVLIAAVLIPAVTRAEEENKLKYAYVNMEKVLSEYVLFEEARRDAETKINDAKVADTAKLSDLQSQLKTFDEKLQGPLTPEAEKETMAQANAIYQQMISFRSTAIDKYKQIEQEAFEPVYKKVYDKIDSYAKKEDYELVFDYTATLLYADPAKDISSEIIKELNEEAGVGGTGGGGGP